MRSSSWDHIAARCIMMLRAVLLTHESPSDGRVSRRRQKQVAVQLIPAIVAHPAC
jgi:hypothetical protein